MVAVGTAEGVALKEGDVAGVWKAIEANPPAMTSSMSHDRRAGKPLEVNYLSGAVVRLGQKHGVPTPTHTFITQALAIDAGGKR